MRKRYLAPNEFLPVLKDVLPPIVGITSKLIEKIADGLSLMDKENPVLNAFIVENHTDVKKDELKII